MMKKQLVEASIFNVVDYPLYKGEVVTFKGFGKELDGVEFVVTDVDKIDFGKLQFTAELARQNQTQ